MAAYPVRVLIDTEMGFLQVRVGGSSSLSIYLFFSRTPECLGLLPKFTVNFVLDPLTLRYHVGRDIIER